MRSTTLAYLWLLWLPVLAATPSSSTEGSTEQPTVLIELFTSQGCSSCPPADRLLADLADRGELDGIVLLPLSFHVDYWNYIGWTDPFSSAEWSNRQRRYARAFGLDTIYTPQIFLNGRAEVVGSDEREVRRLIRQTAAPPVARLELEIESTSPSGSVLAVRLAAHPLPDFPARRLAVR
ncbi:MAG: DUF1223 domain-containing protein, partial [Thermoanaerobaculia bacterium]|nr:DUF1223 domain-containing protein [Thermoanaerobaculia bacterium]